MNLDTLTPVREAPAPSPADLPALADAGEPMIVRGLVAEWEVVEAGRTSPASLNGYLKALDRGAPGPVMEAPHATGGRFGYGPEPGEFTFTRRQRPVAETLDRVERALKQEQAPVIAIQMLPLAQSMPDFVQRNPMPLLPGIGPLLWLGGPVKTQIHNDRDHNLACVVAGHRRFVLFPPDQVGNLYIGPASHPPSLSLVDPEAPDLHRFPRFADALAVAQVAELAPGDALLMPRNWWHHVTSRDPYNAMVNYWWGGVPRGLESPHDAFLMALLALKPLPAADRAYWRAMFETHVFAEGEAGVAHLSESARGHLGRLGPKERAALKQQLRALFSQPQ